MRAGLACFQPLFKGLFKGGVIVTVSDMSWQCVPRLCSSDGYHHLVKFSLRRCTSQSHLFSALVFTLECFFFMKDCGTLKMRPTSKNDW